MRPDSLLLLVLVLFLMACAPEHIDSTRRSPNVALPISTALEEWVAGNPRGALGIRPPFFDVSGVVGESSLAFRSVFLRVMPNLTLGAAGYVVGSCASLGRVPVNYSGGFVFRSLPFGQYVAVTYALDGGENSSLTIQEFEHFGYFVAQEHGFRDGNRIVAVFSVQNGSHVAAD